MKVWRFTIAAVTLAALCGCNFGDAFVTNVSYGIRDSGGFFNPIELVVGAVQAAAGNVIVHALF